MRLGVPLLAAALLAPSCTRRLRVTIEGESAGWLRGIVEDVTSSKQGEFEFVRVRAQSGHPLLWWTRSREDDSRRALGLFIRIPRGTEDSCIVPAECSAFMLLGTPISVLGLDGRKGSVRFERDKGVVRSLACSLVLEPESPAIGWSQRPYRIELQSTRVERESDVISGLFTETLLARSMLIRTWHAELAARGD
jgi:hypothetical protein